MAPQSLSHMSLAAVCNVSVDRQVIAGRFMSSRICMGVLPGTDGRRGVGCTFWSMLPFQPSPDPCGHGRAKKCLLAQPMRDRASSAAPTRSGTQSHAACRAEAMGGFARCRGVSFVSRPDCPKTLPALAEPAAVHEPKCDPARLPYTRDVISATPSASTSTIWFVFSEPTSPVASEKSET